ncbi:MAG: peptidoglycan editing factor PgeF [Betaproteobacteria bacterium]|nr:peptidoglycan editing factor PgeF [Betaproteobacteria bacterium]
MIEDGVFLRPDWPAPGGVDAWFTTRAGGVSPGPYASLNLGLHVGDDATRVAHNRQVALRGLAAQPVWLQQNHGTSVADLDDGPPLAPADAAVTSRPGRVCTVLVADCLPVFFCDRAGTRVGVAHAGWRGLAAGVLEATVRSMRVAPRELLAYIGPAIGRAAFEVGGEVRAAFCDTDPRAGAAFDARPDQPGKFLADLPALARMRLQASGIEDVRGGERCTFADPARFFSYRRDGVTGRMGAFIHLHPGAR